MFPDGKVSVKRVCFFQLIDRFGTTFQWNVSKFEYFREGGGNKIFVRDWCRRKGAELEGLREKELGCGCSKASANHLGAGCPMESAQASWDDWCFHYHSSQSPDGNGLWKSETPEGLTAGMCVCGPRSWAASRSLQGPLGDVFLCLPHFWKSSTM